MAALDLRLERFDHFVDLFLRTGSVFDVEVILVLADLHAHYLAAVVEPKGFG